MQLQLSFPQRPGDMMFAGSYGNVAFDPATGLALAFTIIALPYIEKAADGIVNVISSQFTSAGFTSPGDPQGGGNNEGDGERKQNPPKTESKIWKNFDNVRGQSYKTSGTGNSRQFYQWDYTHNDIEVFNYRGQHLGSMDPVTGKMYKPAVPGRILKL